MAPAAFAFSFFLFHSAVALLGASFEVENGVLGTQRDIFLKLISFMGHKDEPIKEVWLQ
jgi:hypothetical protein